MPKLPETISVLLQHVTTMALIRIGFHGPIVYKCAEMVGEYGSRYQSRATPEGGVDYSVGVQFAVNGPGGAGWKMIVVLDVDDCYTVYLWRRPTDAEREQGLMGAVINEARCLYAENLAEAVEHIYSHALGCASSVSPGPRALVLPKESGE